MNLLALGLMRWVTRASLDRNAQVLVNASGGKRREVRGRSLDPRFQYIEHLARQRAADQPAATLERARAQTRLLHQMFGGKVEPGVRFEGLEMQAEAGHRIPLRLYRPKDQDPNRPALAFFHFGGGVVGELDTCHVFCSMLARYGKTAVVSVDYRLAPEHPFPAGLEDCLAAYRWTRANAQRYGAANAPPAVGGDSMGGNFAAVICQELKGRNEPQPALQLLVYPATDMTAQGGSMDDFADAFPLTRDTMAWFLANYVPAGGDLKNTRLSPGLSPDLGGLAPALIYAAGFDPLSDQAEHYASRLREAGVPVRDRLFDMLAHGFTAFTGAIPAADAACRLIAMDVGTELSVGRGAVEVAAA